MRSTSTKTKRRLPSQKPRLSLMRASLAMVAVTIVGGYVLYLAGHAATVALTPVYNTNFPDPTVLNYGGVCYGFSTASGGVNIPSAT